MKLAKNKKEKDVKFFMHIVEGLSKHFGLSVFAVTEGASVYCNYNEHKAVKDTRGFFKEWEKENVR